MYQLHVLSLYNLHIMTGQKQIAEVMHLGHDSEQHLGNVWPPLNSKVNNQAHTQSTPVWDSYKHFKWFPNHSGTNVLGLFKGQT